MSDGRWVCQWCGTSLVAGDGVWTDPGNTGDYCPEGPAVGPTGTSPHLPALATPAPAQEEQLRNTVISEARHAAANNPAIATTGRLRLRAALDAYDEYRALGDESKEEGAG